MADKEIEVLIKANDQASAEIQKAAVNATHGFDGLAARANQAKDNVEVFDKKYGALLQTGEKVGRGMTVAGGAIVASLGLAAKEAATFEQGMREVGTLSDEVAANLDKFGDGLGKVAMKTGQATDVLTKGLYDTISAGVPAAEAIGFVELAAKAAVAGVTDVGTAVDGMTSAMNAWGIEAKNASRISDVFLMAVEKGKTTLPELSGAIGRVASTAAAMGISIEEATGLIAAMTLKGIKTDEAVTGLKATLATVANAAEKAGVKFSEQRIAAEGLAPILQEINEKAKGNVVTLQAWFGSQEAVNSVLAVTGDNASKTAETIKAMGNAAGATDEKFKMMAGSSSVQWGQMIETFKVLVREIGAAVLPALTSLLQTLQPMIEWVAEGVQKFPGLTSAVVLTAGAIGGLMVTLGPILMALPSLISMVQMLSGIGGLGGLAKAFTGVKVAATEATAATEAFNVAQAGGVAGKVGAMGAGPIAAAVGMAITTGTAQYKAATEEGSPWWKRAGKILAYGAMPGLAAGEAVGSQFAKPAGGGAGVSAAAAASGAQRVQVDLSMDPQAQRFVRAQVRGYSQRAGLQGAY